MKITGFYSSIHPPIRACLALLRTVNCGVTGDWNKRSQIVLCPALTLLTLSLLLYYWLGGAAHCLWVCVREWRKKGGQWATEQCLCLFSTGCFLWAAVIDWKRPGQALHSEQHIKTHSWVSSVWSTRISYGKRTDRTRKQIPPQKFQSSTGVILLTENISKCIIWICFKQTITGHGTCPGLQTWYSGWMEMQPNLQEFAIQCT